MSKVGFCEENGISRDFKWGQVEVSVVRNIISEAGITSSSGVLISAERKMVELFTKACLYPFRSESHWFRTVSIDFHLDL